MTLHEALNDEQRGYLAEHLSELSADHIRTIRRHLTVDHNLSSGTAFDKFNDIYERHLYAALQGKAGVGKIRSRRDDVSLLPPTRPRKRKLW
jgi:hypothetical protein